MANVSRRFFIGGAFSFAALGPNLAFAAKPGTFSVGRPELVFGVLSDVHVALAEGGRALKKSYGTEHLEKAFAYFRDQGADAVVIAGDMAHDGCVGELRAVAEAWFKVFPDDKAPDGRHVERIFIFGNHDNGTSRVKNVFGTDEAAIKENLLTLDPKRHWDAVFHEEWSPFAKRNVRGYDFIGVNWTIGDCNGRCEKFAAGIVDYYAKQSLDPAKPFFHIQHPHPRGTVHGNTVWGQDSGESVKALAAHPNAISFSGHSHTSLVDGKSIWQGAFTALGTGTLRNIGCNGMLEDLPAGGFENEDAPKGPDRAALEALKVVPSLGLHSGKQGQIVRVYSDRIVFSRRDFINDLPLTDDLVMPLPAAEPKPFAFATRKSAARPPRFAADATLAFRLTEAKPRGAKKGVPAKPCVEITVPPALAEKSAPGIAYDLTVAGADGKELRVCMLTPAFRHAVTAKTVLEPTKCRIALERLAKGELTFTVRAVSVWDLRSDPITAVFRV